MPSPLAEFALGALVVEFVGRKSKLERALAESRRELDEFQKRALERVEVPAPKVDFDKGSLDQLTHLANDFEARRRLMANAAQMFEGIDSVDPAEAKSRIDTYFSSVDELKDAAEATRRVLAANNDEVDELANERLNKITGALMSMQLMLSQTAKAWDTSTEEGKKYHDRTVLSLKQLQVLYERLDAIQKRYEQDKKRTVRTETEAAKQAYEQLPRVEKGFEAARLAVEHFKQSLRDRLHTTVIAGLETGLLNVIRRFGELHDQTLRFQMSMREVGQTAPELPRQFEQLVRRMAESGNVSRRELRTAMAVVASKTMDPSIGNVERLTKLAINLKARFHDLRIEEAAAMAELVQYHPEQVIARLGDRVPTAMKLSIDYQTSDVARQKAAHDAVAVLAKQGEQRLPQEKFSTYAGAIDRLANAWDNLKESVAQALGPPLVKIVAAGAHALAGFLSAAGKVVERLAPFLKVMVQVGVAVGAAVAGLRVLGAFVAGIGPAFAVLRGALAALWVVVRANPIGMLVAALILAFQYFDDLIDFFDRLYDAVVDFIDRALAYVTLGASNLVKDQVRELTSIPAVKAALDEADRRKKEEGAGDYEHGISVGGDIGGKGYWVYDGRTGREVFVPGNAPAGEGSDFPELLATKRGGAEQTTDVFRRLQESALGMQSVPMQQLDVMKKQLAAAEQIRDNTRPQPPAKTSRPPAVAPGDF